MKAFGRTDVGVSRQKNQDNIFISLTPVGNLPNLFIVADGMGGHKAGDVASKIAVDTVIDYISNEDGKDPVTLIEGAIEKANTILLSKSRENQDFEGMGTTLVILTIISDIAYIANIGDSRLYQIDEDIKQITRDHSLVEEMVNLGKLDKDSARNHIRKNVLTRAVGVDEGTVADFFEIQCFKGNRILMCSDGLTNMIEDHEIKEIILSHLSIEDSVDNLIKMANNYGGLDNISSIIIEI